MAVILELITTVGAVDANSYSTIEEADQYATIAQFDNWLDIADEQTKIAHLINATIQIGMFYDFNGKITNVDPRQALPFPRTGIVDSEGFLIDSNIIPLGIKQAQIEQAVYNISTDVSVNIAIPYESASVGNGAVTADFNKDYSIERISAISQNLLRLYGTAKGDVTGSFKQLKVFR